MKDCLDIYFRSRTLTDQEVGDAFKQFARETDGWSFLEEQSNEYTAHVGEPSWMLSLKDKMFEPGIALTKKKDGVFYVANIVPKEARHIPMPEYNAIARRFAQDFRCFIRSLGIPISIALSNENIALDDIIASPKARQFFERYLGKYPTSYHPKDIERLDAFICAAMRYCRKRIDVDQLKRYLREDLNWSSKNAEWCCDRIAIGLDVLEVSRKFVKY